MGRSKLQENVFVISEDEGIVYIHLSGKWGLGEVSIVDLPSFKKHNLAAFIWRCTKDFYVYTVIEGKTVMLHRLITGNDGELHTDHINGSEGRKSLDNRYENLRICTNRENQLNGKVRIDNKTGYKNVNEFHGKYRCMIRINKVKQYFGIFDKPEQAALCYNICIPYFSDVYQLNEIPEGILTQEEIEQVTYIANKRVKTINSPYKVSVNQDFNKFTDKVRKVNF